MTWSSSGRLIPKMDMATRYQFRVSTYLLGVLDAPENRTAWMSGTPEDWATESLLAAREAYQDPQTGKRIKSGTKLGDAYQAKNLPVARQRLAQAGMRLAWVLNEAFAEK
jgi:hypothetical protein